MNITIKKALHILSILFMMLFMCNFIFQPMPVSAQSFKIQPPFSTNHKINAQLDHYYPNYSHTNPDSEVTIDNGDHSLEGQPHQEDPGRPYYYAGHPGTDFEAYANTPVLAVASGVIYDVRNFDPSINTGIPGYGKYVYIDHQNGYITLYAHLNSIGIYNGRELVVGDPVEAGYEIGKSGNTGMQDYHLHFGVYLGPDPVHEQYPTDPFGWTGRYADPLINYPSQGQGHQAECLWRSLPQDPISCNDIIFADQGSGFVPAPPQNWSRYPTGNGGCVTSTHASSADNVAFWYLYDPLNKGRNVIRPGTYQIFVYLPKTDVNQATETAMYVIHADGGTYSVPKDQRIGSENWILLGVFRLNELSYVVLHTDQGTAGKWVYADDIKFRPASIYLPILRKEQPTQ
jgi:murein DD-endopeptidase MepM/ murein hydrolase activator NlpD